MKLKETLLLKKRHKWFSCDDKESESGWFGPQNTIELAVLQCTSNWYGGDRIFIAQGRKLTKAERDEYGDPDWTWEVESENAFEVILPKILAPLRL